MKRKIKAGTTSHIENIVIDDSSSTTGAGLGSLLYNSAGLAAKYKRAGDATWTTITLATATAGTWASGGFIESDSGAGGGYEFHPPNAALASGVAGVIIELYGATNMAPVRIEYELDAVNYQSATWDLPLPATLVGGRMDASVGAMAADTLTAAALAADAGAELAALVETYIVNEGDATAVMQAIADLIAADWVAGDATPLAIAAAVRTNLATELARIDEAISAAKTLTGAYDAAKTAATQTSVNAIPTLSEILAGGDIDGYTLEETLKLCLSALVGILSGADGSTITIQAADGSKARITTAIDATGRTSVILDATG